MDGVLAYFSAILSTFQSFRRTTRRNVRDLAAPEDRYMRIEHLFLIAVFCSSLGSTSDVKYGGYSTKHCAMPPFLGVGFLNCELPTIQDWEIYEYPAETTEEFTLKCTSSNISYFKPGTFSDFVQLREIRIFNCNIDELDFDIFNQVVSLNSLLIAFSPLTFATRRFSGNISLRVVKIISAKLTQVPTNLFSNFKNLTTIDFSVNSFAQLGKFGCGVNNSRCPQLKGLYLNYNNITEVKSKDLQFLNLEILELTGNKIEVIETGALNASIDLIKVSFGENNLQQIEENLFEKNVDLEFIDLSSNAIQTLPSNIFRNLSSLEILFLKNNKLELLHQTIFSDVKLLNYLDLSGNRIKVIPPNLSNVQYINLQNNLIERNFFSQNHSCINLNLAYNKIQKLDDYTEFSTVYKLNLSHNLIEKFDFSNINNEFLEILDVSYNQIDEIINSEGNQEKLKLKKIIITNNKLKVFSALSFPKSIEFIDISSNNISKLPSLTKSHLPNLLLLNFTNNSLREIEFSEVYYNRSNPPFRVVPEIQVDHNPLICSCNNKWIKNSSSIYYQYLPKVTGFTECEPVNKRQLNPVKVDSLLENDFVCEYDKNNDRQAGTKVCRKVPTKFDNDGKKLCSCYHSRHNFVHIIDCGNVNWTNSFQLDPKYPFPPVATTLFLDNNRNIARIVDKSMEHFYRIKELYLNSSELTSIDQNLLGKCSTLVKLFLHENKITKIKNGDFNSVPKLEILHLHDNKISFLEETAFVVLKHLKELTLHQNYLQRPQVWEMGTSLSSVSLRQNKLVCDCNYVISFQKWLSANRIVQISEINDVQCYELHISIVEFNTSNCIHLKSGSNSHLVEILCITLSLVVLLVIVIIVIYIYRLEMQVLLYSRSGIRMFRSNKDADVGKTYDAFVSYSNDDDEWVVEEFITNLTEYKLCLHQRDFPVGGLILDSIANAIENSCRTVLILTPSFLESEWCMFEFKSAHMQGLQDRCKRLIVIILDGKVKKEVMDKDLRAYLKTYTYLEWKDKLFWEKLKFAMPDQKHRI